MDKTARGYYGSPAGWLEVKASQRGVTSVEFVRRKKKAEFPAGRETFNVKLCLKQLDDYFKGRRHEFSVPLDLHGSRFDQAVWRRLLKIGYGRTMSYGEIAAGIGKPGAARAVGGANHRNPVGIIVPCHRVIGADGGLTGYGGGLRRKKWLLEHEKRHGGKI